MKISELSHRTGVSADTIRYYVKQALLTHSRQNGYWEFDDEAVMLLTHIRLLRSLNFSIKDIQHVFATSDIIEGDRINHELVSTYISFFHGKLDELEKQRLSLDQAELHLRKILGKLDYLQQLETFQG